MWRSASGESYEAIAAVSGPATMGTLAAPLGAGPLGRWDRASAMLVDLFGGGLSSRADADVFAGANALAVRSTAGTWEILQFAVAELVAENRYRLSRLLRGQLGTEDAMAAGHAAGAAAVLLTPAVTTVPLDRSAVGLSRLYRVGPPAGGIAGPAVVETSFAASGRGILPLSPMHPRARRAEDGRVVMSWIRRTRVGGDAWPGADVPPGECAPSYRPECHYGGAVLATVSAG